MTELLDTIALVLIAAASLLAIWSRAFDDNLIQRVGLAITCFGATMRVMTLLMGTDLMTTRWVITYGVAIFVIGTGWKYRPRSRPQFVKRVMRDRRKHISHEHQS